MSLVLVVALASHELSTSRYDGSSVLNQEDAGDVVVL
jgi:hypothetical protein